MKVPTASVYCSRKRASAMASRKARWPMFSVYHDGLGSDPVIVVGSVILSVGFTTQEFYPEGFDGKSRLHRARRNGQSDGGPPDFERSQANRLQPHEIEGGVARKKGNDARRLTKGRRTGGGRD